jgi:uridine kinase
MTNPLLIGITGGSGSGKTLFLHRLIAQFNPGDVCHVSQDNYYKSIEHQEKDFKGIENFDRPESIDRDKFYQDLVKLRAGQEVHLKEYTFNKDKTAAKDIVLKPAPIIIVEGIFTMYYEEVKKLLDLKLYVESPDYLMMKRRILRDSDERGYDLHDVMHRYEHHVMPAFRKYILPARYESDFIIPNETNFDRALEVITAYVKVKLAERVS